jgi:hypothetical protein
MKTPELSPNIKQLFFLALLSLFFLTHAPSNAQTRVHAYLDGVEGAEYFSGALGIEIEKQLDVDYSASIGLGYREHGYWSDNEDGYMVTWGLLEIPVALKYYIHPALGLQVFASPRFMISTPSGFGIGSGHDVAAQTTPGFNTNVGMMVITGGSFLGLFSLPKELSVGAGFRGNLLPQYITVNDPDSGEHHITDQGIGFTARVDITLFSLKRKKL